VTDLRLIYDENALRADLRVMGIDIETDGGIETAIIISLFSDRRAEADDALPAGVEDRRGWFGDGVSAIDGDLIGSRLWLLAREKQLSSVTSRARQYAREALQWLMEDGIANAVDVVAEIPRPGVLALSVTVHRPTGEAVSHRYDYAWAAQAARAG
jgi:phage gp46-like protein